MLGSRFRQGASQLLRLALNSPHGLELRTHLPITIFLYAMVLRYMYIYLVLLRLTISPGMVAHMFNPSTQRQKPAWWVSGQPGLHSDISYSKTKQNKHPTTKPNKPLRNVEWPVGGWWNWIWSVCCIPRNAFFKQGGQCCEAWALPTALRGSAVWLPSPAVAILVHGSIGFHPLGSIYLRWALWVLSLMVVFVT